MIKKTQKIICVGKDDILKTKNFEEVQQLLDEGWECINMVAQAVSSSSHTSHAGSIVFLLEKQELVSDTKFPTAKEIQAQITEASTHAEDRPIGIDINDYQNHLIKAAQESAEHFENGLKKEIEKINEYYESSKK